MTVSTERTVADVQERLSTIIDQVRAEHAPVYLLRDGYRVAALIDADDLDRLLELAEDKADILEAERARAEMLATREAPIPWETVKDELGLT